MLLVCRHRETVPREAGNTQSRKGKRGLGTAVPQLCSVQQRKEGLGGAADASHTVHFLVPLALPTEPLSQGTRLGSAQASSVLAGETEAGSCVDEASCSVVLAEQGKDILPKYWY